MRTPLTVIETLPALRMIELFRSEGIHLAIVVDEYGSIEGMVTPTDILTGIAGDLPDLGGPEAPGAVQREDGSWLLDGSLPIHAAARILDAADVEDGDYATLAGLVIEELGHLPVVGECMVTFTAGNSRSSTSTAAASTRCSRAAPPRPKPTPRDPAPARPATGVDAGRRSPRPRSRDGHLLRAWLAGLLVGLLALAAVAVPGQHTRMVLERATLELAYAMPDGTLPCSAPPTTARAFRTAAMPSRPTASPAC